jgi:outer membrane protein assembly factor BamA
MAQWRGGRRLLVLFLWMVCLLPASPASPAHLAKAEKGEREAARERYKARKTWEKIVSFPGEAIYFPFKMIFKGAGATAAYVDEKKVITRVQDVLESDDGLRALKPTYASRYGAGFKLHQKGLLNPESKLSLNMAAGLRRRQKYELSLQKARVFAGFGDLAVHYQLLSDESFFGLGPNSSEDQESNYAHEQAAVAAGFGKDHGEFLSWTVQARYELNNILEGRDDELPLTTDLFIGATLPGIDRQVKIAKLIVGLEHDSRNRQGNPSSGGQLSLDMSLSEELGDDQFGFWQVSVDAIRHYHLFYRRVLALRVGGRVVRPISGRQIPFYELSELGRRETIRGYRRGRYLDRDMVLCTAEYRYPLRANQSKQTGLDALLFVDAGQVCSDFFDRFDIDAFKVGFGCGVRLYNRDGENIRFEVGWGEEQVRLYLVLN